MNGEEEIQGVYRGRTLCFAFQGRPGPVRGVLGGILMSHQAVSGKIHQLSEQPTILELLKAPDLEQLAVRLQGAGFTVLSTPRKELEWALV